MKVLRRSTMPSAPLLRTYVESNPPSASNLCDLPTMGRRVRAVLAAQGEWLRDEFLDAAPVADFQTVLRAFYEAVVDPPLHSTTLHRRTGLVRHGLAHVLRSPDALPLKLGRCLDAAGPYYVVGLGPAFWSAVAQALDPDNNPAWTPSVVSGLRRLSLNLDRRGGSPAVFYAALLGCYRRLRAAEPTLTALHLDHFLTLVSRMRGRDLWSGAAVADPLPAFVHWERSRMPLRNRLKERGKALAEARAQLLAGLKANDPCQVAAALTAVEPAMTRRPFDWALHGPILVPRIDRLYHAENPVAELTAFDRQAQLCGAGRGLAAAVLHLRSPHDFPLWDDGVRAGLNRIDDAVGSDYPAFAEAVGAVCDRYRMHPLEAPAVLAASAESSTVPSTESLMPAFGGFCADTFRFLAELRSNNRRDWMEGHRDRYHFAVSAPLTELCRALAERYVGPVLRRVYGWDLETDARSGRAVSRIVKNAFGRWGPYQDVLWITFYRRDWGSKSNDVQFFARVSATGLSYGLRLGPEARAVGRQFRRQVQDCTDTLFDALHAGGAFEHCRFGHADDLSRATVPTSPGDLRDWAAGRLLVAAKALAPADPLLTREELVGDILLTFDRLLPAYACAVADNPRPLLECRAARRPIDDGDRSKEFHRATSLSAAWLRRALDLLHLKRQLILQGVPGTGKTYVARALARVVTGGRDERVRLVQFHSAFSYEEFVEGIKARTVEIDGRHDVTYPVEEGLLCTFAAEAARHPSEPFVLLIDEINRGNLPRIFGELLYLLEYRDQAVTLPYSRRDFRLPPNVYLIGTMNAADRSVAVIDQALRRRFSFLEMPPDAAVLAAWLEAHPPRDGDAFTAVVVRLFEELNARLRADLSPERQIGHSYFMVPDLDDTKLGVIWEHHIAPLLREYFAGQPGRTAAYQLPDLLAGRHRRRRTAASGQPAV
jgi:hypothetical protein